MSRWGFDLLLRWRWQDGQRIFPGLVLGHEIIIMGLGRAELEFGLGLVLEAMPVLAHSNLDYGLALCSGSGLLQLFKEDSQVLFRFRQSSDWVWLYDRV